MRTHLSSGHGNADAPTFVLYFRLSFGGILEIASPCNLNFGSLRNTKKSIIHRVGARHRSIVCFTESLWMPCPYNLGNFEIGNPSNLNVAAFILNVAAFILNVAAFILNDEPFILNVAAFILNVAAFILNVAAFILDVAAFTLEVAAFILNVAAFILEVAAFILEVAAFILEIAAFTLNVAPLSQNDAKYLTIAEYTD